MGRGYNLPWPSSPDMNEGCQTHGWVWEGMPVPRNLFTIAVVCGEAE